jgi:hypothetical protein
MAEENGKKDQATRQRHVNGDIKKQRGLLGDL